MISACGLNITEPFIASLILCQHHRNQKQTELPEVRWRRGAVFLYSLGGTKTHTKITQLGTSDVCFYTNRMVFGMICLTPNWVGSFDKLRPPIAVWPLWEILHPERPVQRTSLASMQAHVRVRALRPTQHPSFHQLLRKVLAQRSQRVCFVQSHLSLS